MKNDRKVALYRCTFLYCLQFAFLVLLVASGNTRAEIVLPSSAPIDVFHQSKGSGIGTYILDLKLLEKDDDYYDIGNVDYSLKGVIYSNSVEKGSKFEESYIAGNLTGVLNEKHFTTDLGTYDNTYDKSGFFLGYRPAYSMTLSKSDKMDTKFAYTLPLIYFQISGDYSLHLDTGTTIYPNWAYDETSRGIATKPTAVLQPTWFVTKNFGVTIYVGASALFGVSITDYENKVDSSDYDTEVGFFSKPVQLLYGYDFSVRGIFGAQDSFNVSSAITPKSGDVEEMREIIVRYQWPFD